MISSEYDKLPSELRDQLQLLESAANNFGLRITMDSYTRKKYIRSIDAMSKEILRDYEKGLYSLKESAQRASALRNEIMAITRKHSTELGKAISVKMKPHGLTFTQALESKSKKLYARRFNTLSKPEQSKVYLEVVYSSGRDNSVASSSIKYLGKAGRLFLILSLGLVTYDVYHAKDRKKALVYNAAIFSGSAATSAAGGGAAGLACGPGAPICVTIGIFIGGIIGAIGTQYFMSKTDFEDY